MSENDPDLERSFLELGAEYNPVFFEWLKSTVNLDVIRSLELNTFLLNYFISLNYFPSHELIDEIYRQKKYTEDQKSDLKNFRDYTERMHGIYILMTLKYDSKARSAKRMTERILNGMDLFENLLTNSSL